MNRKKLLVICGPTATGKTSLGIELAKKFGGEIVSADSRQVYKGMDIGTGKDIRNLNGAKVWLLDIMEPSYKFNVADYKKCTDIVLEDIWKRGKLPIVVGGTGFYIKALVDGIGTMGIEPDWELRKILSVKDTKILGAELKKLDPEKWEKMNESDRRNPRRLVRAIEIATKTQKTVNHPTLHNPVYNLKPITSTLFIGLTASFPTLYQRIDQRVDERVKTGIENEIRGLLKKGYDWDNSVIGTTLAYGEWKDYFEGKASKEEIIQKWKYDEHNYARRQMTWFKKDERINWFDISDADFQSQVEIMVKNWYIREDV